MASRCTSKRWWPNSRSDPRISTIRAGARHPLRNTGRETAIREEHPAVVEAAALIGSRFDRALLSSVVDLDGRKIDELLEELTRVRVLEPTTRTMALSPRATPRGRGRDLTAQRPRRLHSRIADALVAASADANPEWPLVAHHFEAAERFDEAARAHQKASANARRRGALNEARTCLDRALANIGRTAPSRARDKREIAIRLEAGLLASVAQGHASTEAAAEFERCLQLIGPDPTPELYATLNALWTYYTARGDLRRGIRVGETLRAKLADVPGANLATAGIMGILAGFQGDFYTARDTLEGAIAGVGEATTNEIRTYYGPNDPIGGMLSFLAFIRFVQGDLAGANAALTAHGSQEPCRRLPAGRVQSVLRAIDRCVDSRRSGRTRALRRTRRGTHLAGKAIRLR